MFWRFTDQCWVDSRAQGNTVPGNSNLYAYLRPLLLFITLRFSYRIEFEIKLNVGALQTLGFLERDKGNITVI